MIASYPKAKKIAILKDNRLIDYAIIKECHKAYGWPIEFMCKQLDIARSAYYKWLKRESTKQEIENEEILKTIKEIATSNNDLFGAIKMTYAVNNKLGTNYNRKRIYRLMCINDMKSAFRAKKRYNYKRSTPEVTSENILDRDFLANCPNEKWCTDVTELQVPGTDEKIYLSPVIDLYDDSIVHHQTSEHNDNRLAFDTIDGAHRKEPEADPLLHSDRGSSYTSKAYQAKLEAYGMEHSMSRVSKCIDNGPCENIQGIIKEMLAILHPDIKTKEELIQAIDDTIAYYNNEYPMKRFKGKTPSQVRQEAMQTEKPVIYPIPKNPKIEKFWAKIKQAEQRKLEACLTTD